MRRLFALIFILFFITDTYSQSDKKVVAVMPFLTSLPQNRSHAAQLQSIALQTFNSNTEVTFVDRSTDPLVLKELDNQIREQSISSKVLVQQGKLSGSVEIIVGNLASISVEAKEVNGLFSKSEKKYMASVSFSLQVVDAATGLMISSKDFNGNTHAQDAGKKLFDKGILGEASNALMADTEGEAVRKAINATKQDIKEWISDVYPHLIKLLNIESRNKKGFPEVVLMGGFGSDISAGKSISIVEVTFVDDGNGNKLKREKKIGEMKVAEIQGQITVCRVKSGEEVLEEKMKNPSSLKFNIQ